MVDAWSLVGGTAVSLAVSLSLGAMLMIGSVIFDAIV